MNLDARELAATFDLERLTPEFYANPYPTYRALREAEPVKRLPNGSYFLTRYDDLVAAYKNTKAFSSDKKKEFSRAPHHEPRLQRSPGPYPRPPPDHGCAVAARDRRHGARSGPAGRPPPRRHRRQGQGGPDRRFRRRDPDRGDRQPARRSRGRARALARLVAGDPRCAGAGDRPGRLRPRQQGGGGLPVVPRRAGGAAAGQARQSRPRRADPAHSGRGQWRAADRKGAAA